MFVYLYCAGVFVSQTLVATWAQVEALHREFARPGNLILVEMKDGTMVNTKGRMAA